MWFHGQLKLIKKLIFGGRTTLIMLPLWNEFSLVAATVISRALAVYELRSTWITPCCFEVKARRHKLFLFGQFKKLENCIEHIYKTLVQTSPADWSEIGDVMSLIWPLQPCTVHQMTEAEHNTHPELICGFHLTLQYCCLDSLGAVFTVTVQKFNPTYLDSDILPGTLPCSWNCWHCRSSRRNRNACTADSRCQRSSVSPALDRDQELRLNDMDSCFLGKGEDNNYKKLKMLLQLFNVESELLLLYWSIFLSFLFWTYMLLWSWNWWCTSLPWLSFELCCDSIQVVLIGKMLFQVWNISQQSQLYFFT